MKILPAGQYYGERRAELTWAGVTLSEYDYATPRTDWHYHENPYLMYVLGGKLMDVSKRASVRCPAGSLVLHD